LSVKITSKQANHKSELLTKEFFSDLFGHKTYSGKS